MSGTLTDIQSTRDYFDTHATEWHEEWQLYFTENVRTLVADLANFAPGDQVMDYGAGSGFLTRALLDRGIGPLIAADVSLGMLDQIGADPTLGPHVELRFAEGERIPASDGELDGIVTNMVLHHLGRPEKFFCEARRVLRPGGILIATDLLEHGNVAFQHEQHDLWPGFQLWQIEDWLRGANFADFRTGLAGQRCCGQVAAAKGGFEIFYCRAKL